MFILRYCLRRNWLNGKCKIRTFTGHTQGKNCEKARFHFVITSDVEICSDVIIFSDMVIFSDVIIFSDVSINDSSQIKFRH